MYLLSVSGVLMSVVVGREAVYDRDTNKPTGDNKDVIILNIVGHEYQKGALLGGTRNLYVRDLSLLSHYSSMRGKAVHFPVQSTVVGKDTVTHYISPGYDPRKAVDASDLDATLDIAFTAVDRAV